MHSTVYANKALCLLDQGNASADPIDASRTLFTYDLYAHEQCSCLLDLCQSRQSLRHQLLHRPSQDTSVHTRGKPLASRRSTPTSRRVVRFSHPVSATQDL